MRHLPQGLNAGGFSEGQRLRCGEHGGEPARRRDGSGRRSQIETLFEPAKDKHPIRTGHSLNTGVRKNQ